MHEKFNDKYRIATTRLKNWNYGSNAQYFITICTWDRTRYFGEIIDKKMYLSQNGQIAQKYWQEIPNKFPFVTLDAFVVMPNHIHGIIVIDKQHDTRRRDAINRVSTTKTHRAKPNPPPGGITGNKNPMLWDNLSRVIRWYKGRISFEIHKYDEGFAWQSRFYDHIIRNERSHRTIVNYILNNPMKWDDDNYNKNEP